MKCPRCQQENPSHAEFCLKCGTPVNGLAPIPKSYADIKHENERLTGENEGLRSSLHEAIEQQTATSEILRVISSSPTDVAPVFQTILSSTNRLCEASFAVLWLWDGEALVPAAHANVSSGLAERLRTSRARPRRGGSPVALTALEQAVIHVPDVLDDPRFSPADVPSYQLEGARSILAVPMLREGSLVGVINTWRLEPRAFTDKQVELLKTFADQAVIAIENVRLFTELQEKNRQVTETLEQQTATAEILSVISSSPTDLQPVLETVVKSAARFCGADDATIFQLDGTHLRLAAHHGPISSRLGILVPVVPGSVVGRSVLGRLAVQAPDVQTDQEFPEASAVAREVGYRAQLSVPLLREGAAIGTIQLRRADVGPFSEKQISLLQTFADQAVIAIENVRLFNETKETLERQTASSEILRLIASSPTNVQPVLDVMAESATRLCATYDATIFRLDGDVLRVVAHFGPMANPPLLAVPAVRGTVSGRAVLDRQTVQVTDLQAEVEAFPEGSLFARQLGHRTLLSVPLLREGVAIGAIGLRRTEVQPFTDKQIALLQTFADQAVIAIENVRLFTELQQKNEALTHAHAQVSEALEQQTATADILRVISRSPSDIQPVFDAIVQSAVKLCEGLFGTVLRLDGDRLYLAAHHNLSPAGLQAYREHYPVVANLRETVASGAILDRRVVQVIDSTDPAVPPRSVAMARATGFRGVVVVPMLRDGEPIGVINVARRARGPFTDRQVALLQTFAEQAVIAIENVRLFKELEARNRDLTESLDRQTATADILRVISQAQTDVQPVFEAIADSAMRLFGAWSAAVWRYDSEYLVVAAARGGRPGSSEAMLGRWPPRRPADAPFTGRTVSSRRVQQIIDAETDPTLEPVIRESARERGWRTTVQVPMLRGDDVVGVIGVTRAQPGGFSPAEVALLQTFADQAVIAIENARLLTELQARTTELQRSVGQLTALGEVGQAVSSSLDLETVLTTIVSRAVQLSGLEGGVIFEYDESAEEFVQRATTQPGRPGAAGRAGVRKGEGVVGRTAVTLEPVQVPDIRVVGAYESRLRETLVESGVRALLAVPIIREGRVLGGLAVSRTWPGEFPPEIVDLLRTFATQSALAIQNARLYQEIEDKSRQLEAASQHKSEFLANMSHELRTPLNAIIGFSEVLSERMFGELNEKQEEYLKDIHASGQHLLSLINDILDLSKIEAGRMELELTDFNLPATLDSALTLVRERAGRHSIALHLTVDQRIQQVRADERKVRQVVLNLLSNAIKFTPEGGRMDVRAVPGDGVVEVSVSDTGVGIAPEDQEAIFEEFRQVGTAAKKVEGTGLGLALSRKFIELHGGRISVESEPGAGSTFMFTLPRSPA